MVQGYSRAPTFLPARNGFLRVTMSATPAHLLTPIIYQLKTANVTSRPTQIQVNEHRTQCKSVLVSVSVQYEHLRIILLNKIERESKFFLF